MRSQLQWKGDNVAEIEKLLGNHLARADKEGDKLHLIGIGLNIEVALGDSVIVDGDRLGILRANVKPQPDPFIVWTGANVDEFTAFLKPYGVWLAVTGEKLSIYGGNLHFATMGRGDRITISGGNVVVSRAGKDHRVQ